MEQQKLKPCGLSQDERLSLWRSRPWRHRLEHRWNVVRALFGGQITLRTAWFGLKFAHLAVALVVRAPARGMVMVCPAAAQEFFAHDELVKTTRLAQAVKVESKSSTGAGLPLECGSKVVDRSEGTP